ncbi:MAG: hypothetical protein ACR2FM_03585 [Candidatus Saccharimonadales bacterium]
MSGISKSGGSNEALNLMDKPHPAPFSWLVADRNKTQLAHRSACMVLDDFISFAQEASQPQKKDRNSKDIHNAFSKVAIFCERTPVAQEYVRRGFTASDRPADTIPQLAIPVFTGADLFNRLLLGELGNRQARRVNKLAIRGVGEHSLRLACAAIEAVNAEHPELLQADVTDQLPPIGTPLLELGDPKFIERIAGMGDIR